MSKLNYILVVLGLIGLVQSYSDSFHEELLIKPLFAEKLYSHFQFTTKWDLDNQQSILHTHLFPRALAEVIDRFNVEELHISLTAGLWRYESWGYPVVDAAPGAEVWAWFKPDTNDIDHNWIALSNALSGLFCASLNFVDSTNSIVPEILLRPQGVRKGPVNSTFLRFASLPREIVCTENLTPWKKMLPCDSKAGLAQLLNAGYIHKTQYHSVSLHFRSICRSKTCEETSLELRQMVDLVYDYKILKEKNWSMRKLFGQGLFNSCPLAQSSYIYVDLTTQKSAPFTLDPAPNEYIKSSRGGFETTYAKYNVKHSGPISINARYENKELIQLNIPPPIYASQYKTGYGQQNGGIVTQIYNNHWDSLEVVVLQNLPWFVPIYLHTMKIRSDGVENRPLKLIYKPGKLRERAHNLEIALRLPKKSTTTISVDFDYVFLKWQEYPPDANHGFYIGSAIISTLLPLAKNYTGIPVSGSLFADSFNASRSSYLVQVRTESIIITLPTPDFSMPYNVICLACTVVALAFGPLHNITTKRLILKVSNKKNIVQKIKEKVCGVFKKKSKDLSEQSKDHSEKSKEHSE